MHEVHNASKSAVTLPTAHGRVSILPNQKKTFEPGMLSPGILKALQGKTSTIKLTNLSEDATALAADALTRIKKKGFAIVHGLGDISVEEAIRRERSARNKPLVRDDFTPAHVKSQENIGPGPNEDDTPIDGETRQVEIQETSPIKTLLDNAPKLSVKDLRTDAKALLGDAMPTGTNVGRDEIIEALTEALRSKE